jgi:hypothetical protein
VSAFTFPTPGERHNASAIPVPEDVLCDLILAEVNGEINSDCPGCESCDRYADAARRALLLLDDVDLLRVLDLVNKSGIDKWTPKRSGS